MGGVTADSWAHAVPFFQLLFVTALVITALVGGLIKGFLWLDEKIGARILAWSESKDFKNAVAEIVQQSFASAMDIQNRLHEETRRSIAELRERDNERADSVKRAHQRIDSLLTGKQGAP